ncbi:hypothetical protein FQP34_21885 [Peribacillus simplex]|uniref:Uncharacterized protein n=2 Tax=Peribacillus simplex TaxID=1478 RepID=A0A8B5XU31_9BACI|nr:hypothetical protein FQP34_21885 [Peribacillus simplex]
MKGLKKKRMNLGKRTGKSINDSDERENSMNRVIQIKVEMKQLETQLEQLKRELDIFRENCNHEFVKNDYSQQCTNCYLIESLQW